MLESRNCSRNNSSRKVGGVYGVLAEQANTLCVCVKVRLMQKAPLCSTSLEPGSKSSLKLEGRAKQPKRTDGAHF